MRAARTATLLLALLPALSWAQQTAPAPSQETGGQAASSEEAVTSKVPLEDIRRFVAVYNAVRAAYVDPVDDKKLMQAAVRGLLLDLDPHSTYFNKEDAQAFDEQASGAYEGIGVELQQQPDNASMKVISPIDDTPAAKAGILAGDLIIAIDGKPISAIDASEPLRLLEPGYGYIRLSTFQADTGSDFQKHLQQLQKQSGGQLKGLVLDLRSNPGGLLTAAVQVADDLLDKGNIVSTRGRISISDARFDATPGDLLKSAPVVVLVDAGSASASEVLAGALRDNKRARVVGSRTFGKGSVQTVLPLDNGDSVKLTTARYYTPSGKSIQATGIVPEVELKAAPRPEDEALPASLSDYSEATLPGHLRGDDEGTEGYHAGAVLPGDGPISDALAELKTPGSVAARLKAEAAKADAAKAAKSAAVKPEAKVEAKPEAKPAPVPAKP